MPHTDRHVERWLVCSCMSASHHSGPSACLSARQSVCVWHVLSIRGNPLHDCLATCDMSHDTAGCQAAQSKVGSAGLLDPLVALLTPPNQVSLYPQQKHMPHPGQLFLVIAAPQLCHVSKLGLQALGLYALLPDMCAVFLCSHAHMEVCCDMHPEC